VVNALSNRLEVTVYKNGKEHKQRYEKGIPQGDLKIIGDTDKVGTSVTFLPDDTIFDEVKFLEATEINRMKRGAYLTPGVTFTIVNEITNTRKRFSFDGGIRTWLRNIVAEQR
jgi:DNA gyrase subunit B